MRIKSISLPSSPTGSGTSALSLGSKLALQYKGAWCTPPRIFIDHQDEVTPHLGPGRVPLSVDPDNILAERGKELPKLPVRISVWRLAKLNSNKAIKAAAKGLKLGHHLIIFCSLRPMSSRRTDSDHSSSVKA